MKKFVNGVFAIAMTLAVTTSISACLPGGTSAAPIVGGELGLDENFKCTITVDGGGQWANFNTTDDMVESETNPYPYNTLEKLAEEYMKLHPNVTVKLNRQSYNADLSTIRSLLTTQSAPDIVYNSTTTLAEDCNKNYYAVLDDYLQMKNPYSQEGENGTEKWFDIFGNDLKNTVDGHYYYVCMERGAMGMIYNKSFFTQHGIEEPETYSQFLAAIEEIHAADPNVVPYTPKGQELDMMYESSMYIDIMNEVDENKDGWANSYEMTKAYYQNIFDFEDERYRTLIKLLEARLKYAEDPNKVTVVDSFLSGQTMMCEASGNEIALTMKYAQERGFEAGVFPLPALDTASYEGLDMFMTDGVGVRRGSSGLCTAWYITNHAFNSNNGEQNRKKINACADFLMFLTAKTNNDRMINDKGVSVPLSGETNEKTKAFKPLIDVYMADMADENKWSWDTFNSSATIGLSFYNSVIRGKNDYFYGSSMPKAKGDMDILIAALKNGMDSSVEKLVKTHGWDTSKW